jgi:benzil reductase ((S)-benzoin forming)
MNYYFVTGTSSGIGKALAALLIQDENNYLTGFSRGNSLQHKQFRHYQIDLSNTDELLQYNFPKIESADSIVLINNAGMLGDIKHIGNIDSYNLIQTMQVNITALMVLTNEFLKAYQHVNTKKIVVNITSGAATGAYDGWAAYCASKAAVDMFTKVVEKEQAMKEFPANVYAIAPGVVDTQMQDAIRKSDESNFSTLSKFTELKESGKLYNAEDVAKKLIDMIKHPSQIEGVVSRIKLN